MSEPAKDYNADWERYFREKGKSQEKAARLGRRLDKFPFRPEKYERDRKIIFACLTAFVLVAGAIVTYTVLTSPETILSVRDTARNDEFRGFPFAVPQGEITGEGRLLNIRLTLDDSRGYILWYFFACNDPVCVVIKSGTRPNDSFTLGDGTPIEFANQTHSSAFSASFLALNKGTDRHFYFMFVQTVDFVRETGFTLEITLR